MISSFPSVTDPWSFLRELRSDPPAVNSTRFQSNSRFAALYRGTSRTEVWFLVLIFMSQIANASGQ